jgi:hypothetical protein
MGNLATPEFLIARWDELCRDPSLRNLPYKIELNAWGKVEMSPASNRHSRLQGELAAELKRQLGGAVLPECSIVTRIGIRTPDVAWASSTFLAAGALEVWIVAEEGTIRYFTAAGEQPKSGFPVAVSLPPPIK